jgi:hypothetical protein
VYYSSGLALGEDVGGEHPPAVSKQARRRHITRIAMLFLHFRETLD